MATGTVLTVPVTRCPSPMRSSLADGPVPVEATFMHRTGDSGSLIPAEAQIRPNGGNRKPDRRCRTVLGVGIAAKQRVRRGSEAAPIEPYCAEIRTDRYPTLLGSPPRRKPPLRTERSRRSASHTGGSSGRPSTVHPGSWLLGTPSRRPASSVQAADPVNCWCR
jgi:hypothetical protein